MRTCLVWQTENLSFGRRGADKPILRTLHMAYCIFERITKKKLNFIHKGYKIIPLLVVLSMIPYKRYTLMTSVLPLKVTSYC